MDRPREDDANDTLRRLLACRGEIYGSVRAVVHNSHDAEDLFQETAVVVLREAAGQRIENFRAWAKEIARRRIFEYLRRRRARRCPSGC